MLTTESTDRPLRPKSPHSAIAWCSLNTLISGYFASLLTTIVSPQSVSTAMPSSPAHPSATRSNESRSSPTHTSRCSSTLPACRATHPANAAATTKIQNFLLIKHTFKLHPAKLPIIPRKTNTPASGAATSTSPNAHRRPAWDSAVSRPPPRSPPPAGFRALQSSKWR